MKFVSFRISVIILLLLSLCVKEVIAQEELEFSGFVSVMPYLTYTQSTGNTSLDNLVHNRLNLSYRINDHLNSKISFRNRMFWGETVKSIPNFKHIMTNDPGFMDLSFNWESRSNYLLNTNVDRLWIEYAKDDFQVKVGRQRVNWSQTMVWNPNDIFNSYSYFDFDYAERPGMDGIRLQYYTGVNSNIEAVVKVDRDNHITAAGLLRSNVLGYDVQLMTGMIEKSDWILGGGWSGDVLGAGFYGETSYLFNRDKEGVDKWLMAVGFNYMLKNSLLVSSEYLYSSNVDDYEGGFTSLIYGQGSVKNISINMHSYLFSLSLPINPLLNISVSYIGFGLPMFKNFYLGPTIDYSIADNLSFTAVSQYFSLENTNNSLGMFLRFKWNF